MAPAAGPLGTESSDPAPDEQHCADADEDRPAVDDDADDEQHGTEDGTDEWTVVTSEEKQHGRVPFWL
jgi:hypothetical protein